MNCFKAAYRDLYLEIVNQILLMNLVARQIWLKDEQARNCFTKIHNTYIALCSKEGLKQKLGDNLFYKYFPNENEFSDDNFFEELANRCSQGRSLSDNVNGVIPGMLNKYNLSFIDLSGESIFKYKAAFIILNDIFNKLDKDGCVSSYNIGFDRFYIEFITLISDAVVGIKNTHGYSYQNIYMCLYHFDYIHKFLLYNLTKKESQSQHNIQEKIEDKTLHVENKSIMLINLAIWLRYATKIYKCNFSRKTNMFFTANLGKYYGNPNKEASSLIINFYDNKPEKLLENNNFDEYLLYTDKLCETIKIWLIDQWYIKNKTTIIYDESIKKEYKEYLSDIKNDNVAESKKIIKIIKSIDGSSTIIYAILAFDCLNESKNTKNISKEKAINFVKDKHFQSSDFPMAGVKKQLRMLIERLQNNYYSNIRNNQIYLLQWQHVEEREFFSYPLF